MANWKNWRQSHASVMSLVNADSESDDNQSVASELERTAHSVSTVDMLTVSTSESIQENSSDTDDFDFVEETISDSESEAEILMDESGEEENNSTLAQDLAVWATEFPLPRDGLNGLLNFCESKDIDFQKIPELLCRHQELFKHLIDVEVNINTIV